MRVGKRVEERRPDEPHESGEADERHAARTKLARDGAIEVVARRQTRGDRATSVSMPGGARAIEPGRRPPGSR